MKHFDILCVPLFYNLFMHTACTSSFSFNGYHAHDVLIITEKT